MRILLSSRKPTLIYSYDIVYVYFHTSKSDTVWNRLTNFCTCKPTFATVYCYKPFTVAAKLKFGPPAVPDYQFIQGLSRIPIIFTES